jgi:tripartite-type tricarboxylate transporter receptor subunit TctC
LNPHPTSPFSRRRWLAAVAATGAALAAPAAVAQAFPSKLVRIVVPYSPGGPSDTLARIIAAKLQDAWKQTVIVENKPGASGVIGTDLVAKSAPDGTNIVVSDLATLTIAPALGKVPYDLERDLAPVTMLTSSPYYVTVHPAVPIHTLKELVDYSKANPGKLNYATAGIGTGPHLAGLLFATRMGLNWTYIPSKGGSQATQDVVSGQADLMFNSAFSSSAFVKSGKLRLLAVSSPKRDPAFPNVPALGEASPGYSTGAFQAMFVRAGTPPEVVSRINADVVKILGMPDVKEKLQALGADPAPGSVESLRKTVHDERERWARLVKEQNIKVDQ